MCESDAICGLCEGGAFIKTGCDLGLFFLIGASSFRGFQLDCVSGGSQNVGRRKAARQVCQLLGRNAVSTKAGLSYRAKELSQGSAAHFCLEECLITKAEH